MSAGVGVAVVGSANLDIVMMLPRFPEAGETVLGNHLEEVAGGKGLNQAVAAAAGSRSAFVGCVGDDEAGRLLLGRLKDRGVVTEAIRRVAEPTGRAFIQVIPDGENTIVVMPLANRQLDATSVTESLATLQPAVVLAQLEVPVESIAAAAAWARGAGARFVLNASPVTALPSSLLSECDPLVVNLVEARSLIDTLSAAQPGPDAAELAAALCERVLSVVVTDGPRGVHVATAALGVEHVPCRRVDVVDTTGAGDEFAGALAAALSRGLSLEAAAELGNNAAARAVQLPRGQR